MNSDIGSRDSEFQKGVFHILLECNYGECGGVKFGFKHEVIPSGSLCCDKMAADVINLGVNSLSKLGWIGIGRFVTLDNNFFADFCVFRFEEGVCNGVISTVWCMSSYRAQLHAES